MSSQPHKPLTAEVAPETPLRVTVLCGFFGAGKSTLLREAIAHREQARLAVLVHDRSDAVLDDAVCHVGEVEVFRLGEAMAELVQRCVGCSLRDSLTDAIVAIARMRRFDRLIIECSGLVEPVMMAEVFNEALAEQTCLAALARLDHLVTVVDAPCFWEDLRSADDLRTRGLSCGEDDGRAVSELLVEQVEYSTLLVLAKSEGVAPAKRQRIVTLLGCVNPEADVLPTSHGKAVVERVLSCRGQAHEPVSFQPGWTKLVEEAPMPKLRSMHWTTGVFRATRPFHPERLWQLIEQDWLGVERCKGYFWLASQPDRCFLWSQTAGVRHYECLGDWWVSTPRDEWPTDHEFQETLSRQWTVEFGDRRQVLAYIGYRLDREGLLRRLQACLLTPSEVLLGEAAWRQFDDPFARATQEAASRDDEPDSN